MFGKSKPVVLDRYHRRGARWSPPRWLVLLLLGGCAGVGGVVYVQERVLPPRLSSAASQQLQVAFNRADGERLRLAGELDAARKSLEAALADKKRLNTELTASREGNDHLRELASSLVAALPPDPRGGTVEVRSARFALADGGLAYDLVLTRDRASAKTLNAWLQVAVTGSAARGGDTSVTLTPVSISMGAFEVFRGVFALPEGFKPRQATLTVLDGPAGKSLGRRVMYVK